MLPTVASLATHTLTRANPMAIALQHHTVMDRATALQHHTLMDAVPTPALHMLPLVVGF